MRSRLIVVLSALALTLFHAEVFAQLTELFGESVGESGSLKWVAFAAAAMMVAARRLR
jgi:hypothetical protein